VDSTDHVITRSHAKKTLGAVDYLQKPEFPHGMLPTSKDIIQTCCIFYAPKQAGQAQRSKVDAEKQANDNFIKRVAAFNEKKVEGTQQTRCH
uniref:Uncharacterized protein n=1 Tax=Sphaeramia orbicularis TaxID=375764 RepID=A0A672ZEK5_9TELE